MLARRAGGWTTSPSRIVTPCSSISRARGAISRAANSPTSVRHASYSSRASVGGQPLQHLHREACPQLVEVAERAAAEGREPEAEDRAHVPVARRAQDALLQAAGGLVEEGEDKAVLHVAGVERAPRRPRR